MTPREAYQQGMCCGHLEAKTAPHEQYASGLPELAREAANNQGLPTELADVWALGY